MTAQLISSFIWWVHIWFCTWTIGLTVDLLCALCMATKLKSRGTMIAASTIFSSVPILILQVLSAA